MAGSIRISNLSKFTVHSILFVGLFLGMLIGSVSYIAVKPFASLDLEQNPFPADVRVPFLFYKLHFYSLITWHLDLYGGGSIVCGSHLKDSDNGLVSSICWAQLYHGAFGSGNSPIAVSGNDRELLLLVTKHECRSLLDTASPSWTAHRPYLPLYTLNTTDYCFGRTGEVPSFRTVTKILNSNARYSAFGRSSLRSYPFDVYVPQILGASDI